MCQRNFFDWPKTRRKIGPITLGGGGSEGGGCQTPPPPGDAELLSKTLGRHHPCPKKNQAPAWPDPTTAYCRPVSGWWTRPSSATHLTRPGRPGTAARSHSAPRAAARRTGSRRSPPPRRPRPAGARRRSTGGPGGRRLPPPPLPRRTARTKGVGGQWGGGRLGRMRH